MLSLKCAVCVGYLGWHYTAARTGSDIACERRGSWRQQRVSFAARRRARRSLGVLISTRRRTLYSPLVFITHMYVYIQDHTAMRPERSPLTITESLGLHATQLATPSSCPLLSVECNVPVQRRQLLFNKLNTTQHTKTLSLLTFAHIPNVHVAVVTWRRTVPRIV